MSNDGKTLAVLIYQLLFAEETRLLDAIEESKRRTMANGRDLDFIELFADMKRKGYYEELSKKLFDILKTWDYNCL